MADGADDGDRDDAAAAAAAQAAADAAAAAADDDADDADADDDAAADDDKPAGKGSDADWKRMARKHEREAKRARADRDALAAKLQERDAADQTEQEKAIEAARREAREEALSEAEKQRRADKLEMAVQRIGSVRGVTVGDGDDAKTVKFADPDDVQMWLDKQIERGEIDSDDIYKNGKVDEAALSEELARLAAAKPGWLTTAGSNGGSGRPAGDVDAGKGAAPKGSTVESEMAAIRRSRTP